MWKSALTLRPEFKGHIDFSNDMSRIIRGIAVVMMVIGHSLPGRITPFAVPLFSFLVGYGYAFAKQHSLRHSALRIWHLLSHFWFILFLICIPAALISWNGEIKISEISMNMFGVCGRFNFYCWYIYFYIAAMLMMPPLARLIDRFGLKATLLEAVIFGLLAGGIYTWMGSWLTTGHTNVISILYRCFRYMPIVIMGYWLAHYRILSKIPLKRHPIIPIACIGGLIGLYLLRGLPCLQWFDLIWAPLTGVLVAGIFNLYPLAPLRFVLTELGLKSMGIWFLHALFFTHSTKGFFMPLIRWIPANNWIPDATWMVRGCFRIIAIIILSYLMALIVDFAFKKSKELINKGLYRLPILRGVSAMGFALLLFSCSSHDTTEENFTEEVYKPSYAVNYVIKGAADSDGLMIESVNPWQGADNITKSLIILHDQDQLQGGKGLNILNGEAKRIVTTSSTHVAMLEALGEAHRIVGVSGKPYISSHVIRERSDSVKEIGYDANIDYETLLSLKPDLVMLSAVSGESPMEKRLKEFHIPYIYIGDYLEESPVGKSEWLIPVGELVGKGEFAREMFRQIPERYDSLVNMVKNSGLAKKKIIVNVPSGDAWMMPSSKSYVYRLMTDAGGSMVYDRNTGNSSRPIDLEEAFLYASKADKWIDTGILGTKEDIRKVCPKFAEIQAMTRDEVYNNDQRKNSAGGNDYYESGIVNPDVILNDLIWVIHPELVPDYTPVYYHKLQ